jgi:hypothetical protein
MSLIFDNADESLLDKLNLQSQYLNTSSQKSGGTIHERQNSIPRAAVSRAHPAPQDLKVSQPEPSVNLAVKVSSPNPLDAIPMSADRRISAYQRITKLL